MTANSHDEEEDLLDRIEEAQDEIDEQVRAAGEQDGEEYASDLKVRVRKADGQFFLSLSGYRNDPPQAHIVRPPAGWWMAEWTLELDRQGNRIWVAGMDFERSKR